MYCIIYYLEKGVNCNHLPEIDNISQMFSILEFTLNSSNESKSVAAQSNESKSVTEQSNVSDNYNQNFKLFFDKYDYKFNDLVEENNFEKKLYILDKINSYNIFHNNLAYNYKSIDDLVDAYDYLSSSTIFLNNYNSYINTHNLEYYSILSMIGTSYILNNFKIYKENFQIPKRKI